jgi:hypothetical protein
MSIEMAIMMPIAIIVAVTLLYLIRLAGVHSDVAHIQSEELGKVVASPERAIFLKSDLDKNANSELSKEVKTIKTNATTLFMDFDASAGRLRDGLIQTEVQYSLLPRFANIFNVEYKASQKMKARTFIGRNNAQEAMPWSDMEKDDAGNEVWVFPKSGSKYHKENCSYVKNEPHEEILSPLIKSKYGSCQKCDSSDMSIGSLAYVFVYGGVYHYASCKTINKYIISMSEEDAKKKGYSSCSKCF